MWNLYGCVFHILDIQRFLPWLYPLSLYLPEMRGQVWLDTDEVSPVHMNNFRTAHG